MNKLNVDPVGPPTEEHLALLTCFVTSLIQGVNLKDKDNIRSATIKGYIKEINELHRLRGLPMPIDLKAKDNAPARLYKNLQQEEDIAKRRAPLTEAIAAEIIKRGKKADKLSKEALLKDITVISRKVGPRALEFAQVSPNKIELHTYPSGKTIIKALCADRFKAKDKKGRPIIDPVANRDKVHSITYVWKIQKNRRNNETKTYTRDYESDDLCVVNATINIIDRAKALGQTDDKPVCVYAGNLKKMRYITADATTKYLRKITKEVYPHMTQDELSYYSCHSFRVWAAVLLNEAGKGGDYIKIRLRWLSESYQIYLRDTINAADNHTKALRKDTDKIVFALNASELPDTEEHTVQEDTEMGEYLDIE